jgi:hypothetical protein
MPADLRAQGMYKWPYPENGKQESVSNYELKAGECAPKETIELETAVVFNPKSR